MKKVFFVLVVVICLIVVLLVGCDKSFDTFIRMDYMSKTDGLQSVFTITHINAVDKKDESVKIAKKHFEEFDNAIRKSQYFFGTDKVYNANNDRMLYGGEKCYIMTDGDSYFAFGKNNEGYYKLTELKATFYFYDDSGNKIIHKSFSIFPYLNGYVYNALQDTPDDLLLVVPYEWNYVKLFYSRLEYAQIDDKLMKIVINAFKGASDKDYNDLSENGVDKIVFYYISQDNLNYIKFPIENFGLLDKID
jgi:hypothetical protein